MANKQIQLGKAKLAEHQLNAALSHGADPAKIEKIRWRIPLSQAKVLIKSGKFEEAGELLMELELGGKYNKELTGLYTALRNEQFQQKFWDGTKSDLLKSEVYHLATHLNLPNEILSATPTDGLWNDDRNDKDQIGASYKEIEWAMNQNLNEINPRLSDREKEVKNIFTRLNLKNKHKMIPIPICSIPKDFL